MSLLAWMAATGAVTAGTLPDEKVITFTPSFFAAAAPPTAYEMIVRLPGFSFERGRDARGLADASGNVLIDGRPPVSKNDLLEDILKRIPAKSVERIELIRGSAPGIDMRGRSVVANVVRRSEAGMLGALTFDAYWSDDGRLLPGAKAESRWDVGDVSLELSVRGGRKPDDQATDGTHELINRDGTTISSAQRDAYAETEQRWLTGVAEMPVGDGRVKLNAAYKDNPYEARATERATESEAGAGTIETETTDEDPRQVELGGRYTRSLGTNWGIELVGFAQWSDIRTYAQNLSDLSSREFGLRRDTEETIWRSQFSWDSTRRFRAEFGAETALNTLTSQTDYAENGVPVPIPASNVRVTERRNEIFARTTIRATDELTLEAGLRHEWSDISAQGDSTVNKSLAFTKPRIAATWNFRPSSQVRFGLSRDVDQLNFDDFVASSALINTGVILAGNPDLFPEQAWTAEIAFETRFWDGGAAVLELRSSRLTDVIDRVPVRDTGGNVIADAPGNIGDGKLDEATVSLTVPLDRIGFTGAEFASDATFRRSRVTDPTTGEEREISQWFSREIEFRVRQDIPSLRLAWGIQAFPPMVEHSYRFSEVEKRKLGDWLTPFVEYSPSSGWLIRAELQSATHGELERTRYLYSGSRAANTYSRVDRRETQWGRALYINVRRTFGT